MQARGTRAWLVRWDWEGDHAEVDDPVVAILPAQWGLERVKTIVEVIHDSRALTLAEMTRFVHRRKDRPEKVRNDTVTMDTRLGPVNLAWDGAVFCGSNPWVEARQVIVFVDPVSQEITWEPIPKPPRVNVDGPGLTIPDRDSTGAGLRPDFADQP